MTKEQIESYLTERCGITPGPWKVLGHGDRTYILDCTEDGIFKSLGMTDDDTHVAAASHSMLVNSIMTAMDYENTGLHQKHIDCIRPYQWTIQNIETALPGMSWPDRRADIEKFMEGIG